MRRLARNGFDAARLYRRLWRGARRKGGAKLWTTGAAKGSPFWIIFLSAGGGLPAPYPHAARRLRLGRGPRSMRPGSSACLFVRLVRFAKLHRTSCCPPGIPPRRLPRCATAAVPVRPRAVRRCTGPGSRFGGEATPARSGIGQREPAGSRKPRRRHRQAGRPVADRRLRACYGSAENRMVQKFFATFTYICNNIWKKTSVILLVITSHIFHERIPKTFITYFAPQKSNIRPYS